MCDIKFVFCNEAIPFANEHSLMCVQCLRMRPAASRWPVNNNQFAVVVIGGGGGRRLSFNDHGRPRGECLHKWSLIAAEASGK